MLFLLLSDTKSSYLHIIKNLLAIGGVVLFMFYEKSALHKDRLNQKFKKAFMFSDKIFSPTIKIINKLIPPLNIGNNINISFGSFIIVLFLLICLII